jgi:hypothetical protein
MARRSSRIPKPLQRLVGGAVLVGTVRAIDLVWRRATGRRPPLRAQIGIDASGVADGEAPDDDTSPAVVRDRLVYALLLDGALRLARRAGFRDDESTDNGPVGRAP